MEDDIAKETPSPSPEPTWEKPVVTYNWVEVTEQFNAACDGMFGFY